MSIHRRILSLSTDEMISMYSSSFLGTDIVTNTFPQPGKYQNIVQ